MKHINIFDFDETLFRVPGFSCREATGLTPYEWFDSPCSLDEVFNIRGISNTLERTKEYCLNYLITHRVNECKDRVLEIIAQNNIGFDETFFLGRASEKAMVAVNLINKDEAESVTIYEDSLWEIIKYAEAFYLLEVDKKTKIKFGFVDKGKLIEIDWKTALALKDMKAERLTII